jgi:hypothetical protein
MGAGELVSVSFDWRGRGGWGVAEEGSDVRAQCHVQCADDHPLAHPGLVGWWRGSRWGGRWGGSGHVRACLAQPHARPCHVGSPWTRLGGLPLHCNPATPRTLDLLMNREPSAPALPNACILRLAIPLDTPTRRAKPGWQACPCTRMTTPGPGARARPTRHLTTRSTPTRRGPGWWRVWRGVK